MPTQVSVWGQVEGVLRHLPAFPVGADNGDDDLISDGAREREHAIDEVGEGFQILEGVDHHQKAALIRIPAVRFARQNLRDCPAPV